MILTPPYTPRDVLYAGVKVGGLIDPSAPPKIKHS